MNPQISTRTNVLARCFPSTPCDARSARRWVVEQLAWHGWPRDSELTQTAALIAGELAANAVIHGGLLGAAFEVRIRAESSKGILRIELADTTPADAFGPSGGGPRKAAAEGAESGRGLHIVETIAAAWGVEPGPDGGKTVWAAIPLPAPADGLPGQD